jgi:hypothetical protein
MINKQLVVHDVEGSGRGLLLSRNLPGGTETTLVNVRCLRGEI